MKLPRARHRWDLTPTRAIRLQRRLAAEVRATPLPRPARLIAGGDVAFSPDGRRLIAGWAVFDLKHRRIVETVVAIRPVRFPYVPGLLSFREAPALIAAARKLRSEPGVFMLDGQGLAHPRRVGLACHVGLLMDRPTIGCAKSRLCGMHDTPADTVGASKPLIDHGELIGRVVRTRPGVKPIYVSIGHRITLDEAVKLTLRCGGKFRLPEPTRQADKLVNRLRAQAR